jgi:4-aminobutyrate aminotransferase
MDVLERSAISNAGDVGAHMLARMAEWPSRHKIVGDVRGRGLMLGVEIVEDQASKARASQKRDAILKLAFERGLLCLGAGPNTIRLSPPLIVSKEHADMALDILDGCIQSVAETR